MVSVLDLVIFGSKYTYRMSRVCESWALEELVEMDEKDMETLLGFYRSGTVPKYTEIRYSLDDERIAFDGSFGWW